MTDINDLKKNLMEKFPYFNEQSLEACLNYDKNIRRAIKEKTGSDLVHYISDVLKEYSLFAHYDNPVIAKEYFMEAKRDGILSEQDLEKITKRCDKIVFYRREINKKELEKEDIRNYGGYEIDPYFQPRHGIRESHEEEDTDIGSWGNIVKRYEQDNPD